MLKRNLKKKVIMIFSAILLIVMTGCAKINGDYQIYEDGEYSLDVTFLIPSSIAELQDIDLEEALITLRQNLYIGGDVTTTPVETMRDGIQYTGYQISRKKALPSEDGPVSISVDEGNREILFTLNNTSIENLWISMNPSGSDENLTSAEALKALEDMGLELQYIFTMPGEILSSSGGIIQNNTVVFNLVDNDLRQIIIRAKIPGLTTMQIVYITGATIFLIGGGVIIYLLLNKKNPIKIKIKRRQKAVKPTREKTVSETIPSMPNPALVKASTIEETIKTPEVEAPVIAEPLGVDMSDLVKSQATSQELLQEFYTLVNHSKSKVHLELGDEIFEVYKNKQTIKKKHVSTKEQDLDLSSTTSVSKKAILKALNS